MATSRFFLPGLARRSRRLVTFDPVPHVLQNPPVVVPIDQ